nr:PREDICTED: MAP7 domain-containing protein 1 isoform X6 [Tribolium castaneum]|eukprot:XP_008199435.1 PREDICTED: MAP7 domain-containing protein 1 isoform X6 [Tribolium castaneum]
MVPEGINSDSLAYLRSILVKSLSSENVSKSDVLKVKQYKNNKKVQFNAKNVVDKEVRIKNLKERQNEERQKKLEEMKAQALAAQRFKEQKELERRKRLEELRCKEDVRRQQVEERKRAIAQADQDRLESILKRNQEREARIEAKKRNERSNIVFAFGSSTPRMLDPTDLTAFWGPRRATSIQNITSATSTQLTRRQSERDLDSGSKKRATSASGLERSGESTPMVPAGCASGYVGRRRTDLMPTIPSRDSPFAASRKSLNHSPASSRPSSSLSQQSTTSVTSSVSVRHRPSTAPRRQRPASIAITGITHDPTKSDNKKSDTKPPLPKTRKSISKDTKDKTTKRKSSPVDTPKSLASPVAAPISIPDNKTNDVSQIPPEPTEAKETKREETAEKVPVENGKPIPPPNVKEVENSASTTEKPLDVSNSDQIKQITNELIKSESASHHQPQPAPVVSETKPSEALENKENEMTASVTKIRINTEEEAKAALAERRRLAREEAERQAEQERLRIEMEAQAELERQRREEEQIQRLIEAQRLAEQERLEEAIRETKRREEEERLRREEEQRSKLLKEEAERKAREEAEKKFAEQQERLKNEEKEREARRKRVEAIMRRTRGVNNANSPGQQNSEDKNENKSENKMNGTQPVEQENGTGTKNGKDVDIVDNIIPDDTVKNANTVSIDTINSTDSINSNNTWQTTQQYGNCLINNNS